ncbi:MAG: iron export ABC transporter permease subunit FetB [candidate division Zixibacteria bacterium 4484_93]|nr:MAG: iron export ABC transporter permease subunit FetB [candidate division Zixibacteria bacterium 4484_93]
MLEEYLPKVIASLVLIAFAMLFSMLNRLRLGKDILGASLRAIVQMSILSLVIGFIFSLKGLFYTFLLLCFMSIAGAFISRRRARGLPGALSVSLLGIFLGAFPVLIFMVASTALEAKPMVVLPLGGMAIGNSMNAISLGLNRLRGEVKKSKDTIEAILSLGLPPSVAIETAAKESIRAAMIPRLDNIRSLGLVWIPGLMAGSLLGGQSPIRAAVYQLAIMFIILASSIIASSVAVKIESRRLFTEAAQLRTIKYE